MRWNDNGKEMKFFSLQRDIKYNNDGSKYREFNLYNVRTGTIFCCLKMYSDIDMSRIYEIETLDFFTEIKDELYTLIMRDLFEEEQYSYDKWILPFFRNIKLEELGI